MKIDIVEVDSPKLSDPVIICGLPGSALVGKLAVDHLIEELPAEAFLEVYLDGMAPQVFIENDGTASALNNDVFFWKSGLKGIPDLILYTADAQPVNQEAEYTLSATVLEHLLKQYNAKRIITLGAFVTGVLTKDPKVYVAATEKSLVDIASASGCEIMSEGSITGMNGILLGIAKLKGLQGYSLLGETSGYALDPKASEALLLMLEKILGVKVDLRALQERAKEAESVLQSYENMRNSQQSARDVPEETAEEEQDRNKLGYIS